MEIYLKKRRQNLKTTDTKLLSALKMDWITQPENGNLIWSVKRCQLYEWNSQKFLSEKHQKNSISHVISLNQIGILISIFKKCKIGVIY